MQLPLLAFQSLVLLLQLLAVSAVLGQRDHLPKVGLGEPLQLTLQGGASLTEVLPTGLQFLRQPPSAVRPLQGVGDATGMGEDLAEVLPDQIVELPRRSVAGGAIFVPAGPGPLLLAGADVVPAVAQSPSAAGELAPAAAEQSPQQVGVLLVVAAREGLVLGELLFGTVELFLGDDGLHGGHRNPLLGGHRNRRVRGPADGMGGRTPDLRRAVARAPGVDLPL